MPSSPSFIPKLPRAKSASFNSANVIVRSFEIEDAQVSVDALVQGRRGDPLAEPVGGVVAADARAIFVHRAEVVRGQVRAADPERLAERGDVRRHATGATLRARDAHASRPSSCAR